MLRAAKEKPRRSEVFQPGKVLNAKKCRKKDRPRGLLPVQTKDLFNSNLGRLLALSKKGSDPFLAGLFGRGAGVDPRPYCVDPRITQRGALERHLLCAHGHVDA